MNSLTVDLMRNNHEEYLNILKQGGDELSSMMNDTSEYSGWFSPHVMLLAYLVEWHRVLFWWFYGKRNTTRKSN